MAKKRPVSPSASRSASQQKVERLLAVLRKVDDYLQCSPYASDADSERELVSRTLAEES